ncbi:cob(I)yrinic acid a,c-diamide adenosyltransferase [Nanoarchaeota archaeon]
MSDHHEEENQVSSDNLDSSDVGIVHIYTGHGKGKTTASLGLALRSVGYGHKIYMVQFLKGGSYTGELVATENHIPNFKIVQFGKGCINTESQVKLFGFDNEHCPNPEMKRKFGSCGDCRHCFIADDEEASQAKLGFEHAKEIINKGEHEVVILDELTYLIPKNYVQLEEVLDLIKNKPRHVELVITGRDAHPELIKVADLVSEVQEVKHPFSSGMEGRKGIEF